MEKINSIEYLHYELFKNVNYPIFELMNGFKTIHITYMLDKEQELIKKIEELTDIKFNLGYIQGSPLTPAKGLMVLEKY